MHQLDFNKEIFMKENATAGSNTANLNACNDHFVQLLKTVKSVLWSQMIILNENKAFLILSFRRVLYVMRFLLGISPASEC